MGKHEKLPNFIYDINYEKLTVIINDFLFLLPIGSPSITIFEFVNVFLSASSFNIFPLQISSMPKYALADTHGGVGTISAVSILESNI